MTRARKKYWLLPLLPLLFPFCIDAQNQAESKRYPDTIHNRRLATAIATESALYLGSISYLQFAWYKDHERVPFHFYRDGAGYLQVDKFGHAFGAYLESYTGYHWLRYAGVPKNKALIYGGSLGFFLQLPIEIFDGLYEGYGFSWADVAANTAGSALVVGQELLWNRQVVKYKFSFNRSRYADQSNGLLGDNYIESLVYDYNGHTYWLSTSINNFMLKDQLPDWLNVAVGYSANGMFGEFENHVSWHGEPLPEAERYRQFLLSLDVDWPEIKTHSKFLNALLKGIFFIKLPFPALEVDSRGQIKGHWLYF